VHYENDEARQHAAGLQTAGKPSPNGGGAYNVAMLKAPQNQQIKMEFISIEKLVPKNHCTLPLK
jgi:hypothetical protein